MADPDLKVFDPFGTFRTEMRLPQPQTRTAPFPQPQKAEEEEPVVIFGAVKLDEPGRYHERDDVWVVLTDPVKFALAEGAIAASSVEGIVAQLSERKDPTGSVIFYHDMGYTRFGSERLRLVKTIGAPYAKEGADPFEAAKAVPDQWIKTNRYDIPKDAEVFDRYGNAQWVWGDFCGRLPDKSRHWETPSIAYSASFAAITRKEIRNELKMQRRRERRAERAYTYKTLPKPEARRLYKASVELLQIALERSGQYACRIETKPLPYGDKIKRSLVLTRTERVLKQVYAVGDPHEFSQKEKKWRTKSGYERDTPMGVILKVLKPLHENWDECKGKTDAEYVKPILDLVFPDEEG